jgi:hypothetical protein
MKKNGKYEPTGVLIHIHGNITRNLPVQLPLSQTSKNFIFFFVLFSSTKLENKMGEQVLQGSRGGS